MDASGSLSGNQPMSSSTPVQPSRVPVTRMSYHGKAGQVFRLHIMNLLMNIITLGIYSFWGKTRIRRYMTSHVAILNDRFEYTGTGKELLFGWLKAMLIFMPVLVLMSIPVINIFGFIIFFTILSLAMYLALRYRLSRTKWRGIRFRLAGSLKTYFFLVIKRMLINIFTLGFKIPKSDILLWSYIANHMSFGDLKFSYEGDHKRLRKIHLITIGIMIVTFSFGMVPLIAGGINKGEELIRTAKEKKAQSTLDTSTPPSADVVIPMDQIEQQNDVAAQKKSGDVKPPRPKLEKEMIGGVLAFYVGIGLCIVARLWYHAALWQERFRGLRLSGLRFKADVTGGGLAKLFIVNWLIVIFTLGLGKPIAAHRTLRYYVTNMRIGGDLQALISRQEELQQKSGMGDALAADVGFDIGM